MHFDDIVTKDIVSFEQLGPDQCLHSCATSGHYSCCIYLMGEIVTILIRCCILQYAASDQCLHYLPHIQQFSDIPNIWTRMAKSYDLEFEFYGPVDTVKAKSRWSVYLTTLLKGGLSPLSG